MNKFIKEQLGKCRVAVLPSYDDNTLNMIIPKTNNLIDTLKEDSCYFVKLENYIINPPSNFDLHTNWNHNVIPKDQYMNCEIVQVMGKMIKIRGAGVDESGKQPTGNYWEGWIPKKSMTIINAI